MRQSDLSRLQKAETNTNDRYYLHHKFLFEDLEKASKYATGRLLDIGCGNKPYQSLFEKCSYLGCDIVQSSGRKVDLLCNSHDIALKDGSFDSILATQVIEHVSEPRLLCSQAARLLKTGGIFIVSGPMMWQLHEEPFDFYRYTKHGFRHLLQTSGFELLEIMPNGGKWAAAGLVLLHAFEGTLLQNIWITRIVNRIFCWADSKAFNESLTSNYVVVARKL